LDGFLSAQGRFVFGQETGRSRAAKHCPRHHFDDTLDRPQLRAVSFTAVTWDNSFLPTVDATACRKQTAKRAAV
jgi:hypothetical protein